jgi:hypothetical protein
VLSKNHEMITVRVRVRVRTRIRVRIRVRAMVLGIELGFGLGLRLNLGLRLGLGLHRFKAEFFLAGVVRDTFCHLLFHLECGRKPQQAKHAFSFFRTTGHRERGIFEKV